MGSSTVTATKLANQANIAMNDKTNQTNLDIANAANEYNYKMFQEQNTWNEMMWNKQNEYNDPSQQMERLVKAGINPLAALGNMDSGNAEQLTSAAAAPAEVAKMNPGHVEPEYDPMLSHHISNILTGARDVVNAAYGQQKLNLESKAQELQERDVSTRERAQFSGSALDFASAEEKRASTEGRRIENAWNRATFGVRAQEESQKLSNLQKQYDNMEKEGKVSDAKLLEINAQRDFIAAQTNSVIAGIEQRNRELRIMQQNADTAEGNMQVNKGRLKLEDEKFTKEIEQWNNENLLRYMEKFGAQVTGSLSGKVGLEGLGVSGSASVTQKNPATLQKAIQCGVKVIQRYAENPTEQNARDADIANKRIDEIQEFALKKHVIPVDDFFNTSSSTIYNPSASWQ